MAVFDELREILTKYKENMPVVAIAELLAVIDGAEAKWVAVVKQLEEEREYSHADFEEYVNEKSPCLDAEYDDYFHRGLERAIKIVRKGGVE